MIDEPRTSQASFCSEEAVDHLAAMMREQPHAASWHLSIIWAAGFGCCIEDMDAPAPHAGWSIAWPTHPATSPALRLAAPAEQFIALSTYLARVTEEHCEAVGSPLDDVRYRLDVYPAQTRLSVLS